MREVEFYPGQDINDAWKSLLEESIKTGEVCYGNFNDKKIYSTDSLDEAFKKVTGKTKAECDKEMQDWRDDYDRRKEEHKARIPELSEDYRKAARGVIREDQYEYWDKIVPIRLGDLYEGMELGNTLDLCKIMRDESLSYDERLRKAYDEFNNQGHSGMSAGLVASMLRAFCPDGEDLADAVMNFRFEGK